MDDRDLSRRLDRIERRLRVIGEIAIAALLGCAYVIAVYEVTNRWGIAYTSWGSIIPLVVAIAIALYWRHRLLGD